MHGDFSNVTFSPDKQYTGVFDLQGRLGLDANQNEHRAIVQHYLRMAIADLVGPAAAPRLVDGQANRGFRIDQPGAELTIGAGRMYVNGLAVTNPAEVSYPDQPPFADRPEHPYAPPALPDAPYLVLLKVWEKHITETEDPQLHEVALGITHPDTSSRAQVTWRVLAEPALPGQPPAEQTEQAIDEWAREWIVQASGPDGHGLLRVRSRRPQDADDSPCAAPPDAGYLGENQLYRVEIRDGGTAADGASFAWSRDNGSVIHPIEDAAGSRLQLVTLGRDQHSALVPGNWVEVVNDAVSVCPDLGRPQPAPALRQVLEVMSDTRTVVLDQVPPDGAGSDPALHPYLRRWDMAAPGPAGALGGATAAGVAITETDAAVPADDGVWIPLENGIEVQFVAAPDGQAAQEYRSGDYWTFPARRVLASVVFDHPDGAPPTGPAWNYAVLAVRQADGTLTRRRRMFAPDLRLEP